MGYLKCKMEIPQYIAARIKNRADVTELPCYLRLVFMKNQAYNAPSAVLAQSIMGYLLDKKVRYHVNPTMHCV